MHLLNDNDISNEIGAKYTVNLDMQWYSTLFLTLLIKLINDKKESKGNGQ